MTVGCYRVTRKKAAVMRSCCCEMHELGRDVVQEKEAIGTLMPATAQGLSDEALANLFAYLFSLGR